MKTNKLILPKKFQDTGLADEKSDLLGRWRWPVSVASGLIGLIFYVWKFEKLIEDRNGFTDESLIRSIVVFLGVILFSRFLTLERMIRKILSILLSSVVAVLLVWVLFSFGYKIADAFKIPEVIRWLISLVVVVVAFIGFEEYFGTYLQNSTIFGACCRVCGARGTIKTYSTGREFVGQILKTKKVAILNSGKYGPTEYENSIVPYNKYRDYWTQECVYCKSSAKFSTTSDEKST